MQKLRAGSLANIMTLSVMRAIPESQERRLNWFRNKAVGIAAVCKLFDIPWEDTIIFGDSNNDLAMFEYAAVKVAMGNGSEKIKALADYITQDMFHYGIRNGLEYLGLI